MRLAVLAVAAAALLAGCINAAEPTADDPPADQPVQPSALPTGNTTRGNTTTVPLKPPVARMEIFQGQQIYKANFVAENATAGAPLQGGQQVNFLGSDSEAVEKTARVTAWDWDFGNGQRATGRSATATFADTGGLFRVKLTVTDSNNLRDDQVVTVGVMPTRTYNETVSASGQIPAGTLGVPAPAGVDVPLKLVATKEGFPVEVEAVTLAVAPADPLADLDLYLLDASGAVVAMDAAEPFLGAGEPAPPFPGGASLSFGPGELTAGTYTVRVVLHLGVNASYELSGEVLYRVINPAVEAQFGAHQH